MENKKIGFIGELTSIEFFRTLGAEVFGAHTVQEAEKIISSLKISDYAMLFITEEVFDRQRFEKYLLTKKLLVIPSLISSTDKGYHIVEELIRKATGIKEQNNG